MNARPTILALIPARGGSKRIPNKNILPLAGKPLIAHSIGHALSCEAIDRTIVCTEDAEIARISSEFGAEIIDRPVALAQDDTPSLPVFQYALEVLAKEKYHPDFVVVLQPTSPLREVKHIQEGINKLIASKADSVFGVKKSKVNLDWLFTIGNEKLEFVAKNDFSRIRAQDLKETYVINGALYVYRTATLLSATQYAMGESCLPLIMDAQSSIDIDEPLDFQIAEFLMNARDANRK